MAKYELLIAVADEADLKSGHKRKKEGDIIAVVPSPHNWGRKEIDQYLVVPIELDKTLPELKAMFQPFGELKDGKKRRYKIDLATLQSKLAELDLAKVRNKTTIYQPYLKQSEIIASLPDYNLTVVEVDCGLTPEGTATVGKNPADVIYDKDDSKLVDVTKVAAVI